MNVTRWLSLVAAVAALSACETTANPVAAGAESATLNDVHLLSSSKSWILAEAKHEDLLYVSGYYSNNIFVLSYPKLKLVGTLAGFSVPRGLCTDNAGNVFITNFEGQDILEYAHGSKIPKANLAEDGHGPYACAVDPTTGNVAVANLCSGGAQSDDCFPNHPGDLAIFPKGKGSPRAYSIDTIGSYDFCAYDDAGNLLVDGGGAEGYSPIQYALLPAGGSSLKSITLNKALNKIGAIEWDGAHFAIVDADSLIAIDQLAIKKGVGKTVRSTPLDRTQWVEEFVVDGSMVIAPGARNHHRRGGSFDTYPIYLWNYPAGGDPVKSARNKRLGLPYGVTLSRAKS